MPICLLFYPHENHPLKDPKGQAPTTTRSHMQRNYSFPQHLFDIHYRSAITLSADDFCAAIVAATETYYVHYQRLLFCHPGGHGATIRA